MTNRQVLWSMAWSLLCTGWPLTLTVAPLAASEPLPVSVAGQDSAAVAAQGLVAFESQIQQSFEKVRAATIGLGGGSGVVISEDGLVLTVEHVAKQPGRRLRVTFPDGRRTTATVLGACQDLDMAVAKIDQAGPWPFVAIDNVELPAENTWLLKVGYPISFAHGQAPAVRVGCVLRTMSDAIISDCPIMGGDSGGPLFDLSGNLVGISSRCQDEIDFNMHVPLASFHRHWQALCSGRELKRSADGSLHPRRPDWDAGFGKNLPVREIPFPGQLADASYVARRPATPAVDRRGRDQARPQGRQSDAYLSGFTDARRAAAEATAQVHLDGALAASGTWLCEPGLSQQLSFVATKASLLGRQPQDRALSVRLKGHDEPFPAQLLGVDQPSDLAILTIEYFPDAAKSSDLDAQTSVAAAAMPLPGAPVLSLGAQGQALVGFVSSAARSFSMRQPPLVAGRAMLGISVARHRQGARITSVVEKSGAAQAGLRVGDVLQSIDGRAIRSADELVSIIAQHNVGDVLPAQLLRGGDAQSIEVTLGEFATAHRHRHSFDNWGGGPFSDRRFEIPHVLPHDTALAPGDCGSPLIDIHGNIVGVNIARALRTTSYALPIEDVWQTITRLQQL